MSERILFVTGKLAEPALRRTVAPLAEKVGFIPEIIALPITVAALLTTEWVGRKLTVPNGTDRVILPGFCRGDVSRLTEQFGTKVESGPTDLRNLPEHFGQRVGPPPGYGKHDIEIIAEINHAPQRSLEEIVRIADDYRANGADIIDLGCDPGTTWDGVGPAVRALIHSGARVSIDSFQPQEVYQAISAGAELVLSINSTNVDTISEWHHDFPSVQVVVIPDSPHDVASLDRTVAKLQTAGISYRIDPILEPIGFGFTASIVRYHTTRSRYPSAKMMMGVGNITELTEVDSAGINVLLTAICQELGITSVLTTQVANWARSSVQELDIARRLAYHAMTNNVIPKYLDTRLVTLRDRKLPELGPDGLYELTEQVIDHNYRLFAEAGELHAINGFGHRQDVDPFSLFRTMLAHDSKIDISHAFYLGYELSKAVTALTLAKNYIQDQPLDWGYLTQPERSHCDYNSESRSEMDQTSP